MKPIDQYHTGMIVRMIVPDKPIEESPYYVEAMIRNFKKDPVVEIIRIEKQSNRIWIKDYRGSTWTIRPDWIQQKAILFL